MIRQSLDRSSSLLSFFKKRAFRIFPGLWVAVLLTVFIIGASTSVLSLSGYFKNSQTWKYLLENSFLIPKQKTLPGLFEKNVETAVNGSLWTLRYELLFYVLLSLLSFVPKSKVKVVSISTLLVCLAGVLFLKVQGNVIGKNALSFATFFFSLGAYFAAGACLSLYIDFIKKRKNILLAASAFIFFLFIILFKEKTEIINILSFSLMLTCFGLHYFPVLDFSRYTGDISYGTYIYAYPIQQALIVWLHPATIWALMLPSFLLSWLAGWLSWHLVEKQFLKRK